MIYHPSGGKRTNSSRFIRSRSLAVSEFRPATHEEFRIHEIAKTINETSVAYLKSILDRHGYEVIKDAWNEMRAAMIGGRRIRSHKKLLNYLIQQRLKRDDHQQ